MITYKNYVYDSDIDVLVRVYPNQQTYFTLYRYAYDGSLIQTEEDEKELFLGEVLFKPYLNRGHKYFSAAFPRGIALAVADVVKSLDPKLKVQISNELPSQCFHLNYCGEHFDLKFKKALKGDGDE